MLKDKIVFITGASSGIGRACAFAFAKEKANLLLCARQTEVLNDLAMELRLKYGIDVHPITLDVRHNEKVQLALATLPEKWRAIDILINNAGLAAGLDPLQEGHIDDWDEMIDTNFKGLLYVTRSVIPTMVARKSGHIINIGSIAGHQVYPKGAVYAATKHAVNALSQGLRMDLMGTNIRVSTVDPGAVETNFSTVRFKDDIQRAAAVYEGMIPLTPENIADAVIYCATRPAHVNISEMIIMPTAQAAAAMTYRE